MRIRSALATVLLTAAMTAGGAATATAFDGPLHGDSDATCSPYFGAIDTDSTGDLVFGGINCRSDDYDID
ncbi:MULTISPECIES: hypothetical protein [Streptomyces]|uniref:Uncharacterized protein n=1 Tax=Streptomyces parvulus TaxID=146923 RepID=A0A191UX06_9ACTN|nr:MULTISPECIES: hypothetical protein [Streptomyces]ANJ07217.1 hypothetical protein Spa2297_09470 [Streptomyces parvulus]MCQ4196923.1 hypothetical protein [Streptomyces parvulus]MZD52734.1 hypothetical protein [Streptomyces sp. SID5606]RDD84776.1 hypothetical protein DVZ84_33145 [Streptomyces parvulus]WHM33271.1 hypothetical protein OH540_25850 [Streptomyces sp. BPPL-273]